jgi:hypothetical protein
VQPPWYAVFAADRTVHYAYDYDRFGNRWGQIVQAGTGYNGQFEFNPASNRVSTAGFAHDASGNQTATGPGSPTLTYDLENFLQSVGSTISYQVDAQGRPLGSLGASACGRRSTAP